MANDKQSLTNYETILWLWDASDEQRIMFLASLNPDQRSQFCDVLRDVLNNPWEGRSALKLTKLNKLLGQNVDRIKKQVQFSGDKTPELDEKQVFRLLHDYTVLNHDGTRRLSDLGRQNLEQLLMTVDAEFETYYDRDTSHPQLMWNGFQNDSLFLNNGMEKTQVEPTDYGELSAKITNYYFPVGGVPSPDPQHQEDDYDYHEEYRSGDDDGISPDSLQIMHLRYLPVFLSYALFAVHAGFVGVNSAWTILFGLITLFGSVKWYNIFKFYDRGWASLLQGFWVLNYSVSLALATGGLWWFALALAWPLVAFWFLAKRLHCHTSGQRKFILIWTIVLGVLGLVCAISFSSKYHDRYDYKKLDAGREAESPSPGGRAAEGLRTVRTKDAEAHIAGLRSREGGISWNGLTYSDLSFLRPEEIETLRLQLTNVMRMHNHTMEALTLENIRPSQKNGRFKVEMSLNQPIYVVMPEQSGFANLLGVGNYSSIDLDTPAGSRFTCNLQVYTREFFIDKPTAYTGKRPEGRLLFGYQLKNNLASRSNVYVQVGSQAEADLKVLTRIAQRLRSQIKADELVARADPTAQVRLNTNRRKLNYLRKLARQPFSARTIMISLPTELKRIVDMDDWSGMDQENRS